MKYSLLIFLIIFFFGCSKEDLEIIEEAQESSLYFPPLNSEEWLNLSPNELGWNESEINNLLSYLDSNNTRAFIVLKNGKIVIEEYFGNNIFNTTPFSANSQWYWASAGKVLTSTLVGIAQQEGHFTLDDPASDYLGNGWTSLTEEKEALITIKHQLTMTSGLDYNTSNLDCTTPSCLTYKTDAGNQWYYHNAPYTLLEKVVENATGVSYNDFTDIKIESLIGMNGHWIMQDYNNVYWSTARDMARFGLLILNKGKWNNTEIITDNNYYNQMINTSQELNPSYGYLWWLNGKNSIIFPSLSNSFGVPLSENAPIDLIAGMGKNGQFVEIIPSKNMVVVRMGEAPDGALVPISFHNEMWEKINFVTD